MCLPLSFPLNAQDRQRFDEMADLYSIIVATEQLEQAFVRDAVNNKDYEKECNKLIAQFKTLRDSLSESVPHIEKFMAGIILGGDSPNIQTTHVLV